MVEPPIAPVSVRSKSKWSWKLAIGVFLVVFLFSETGVVIITLLLPNTYVSSAHIKLDVGTTNATPDFIRTEIQVVQSQVVLGKAIKGLNLDSEWGRRYFQGEQLKQAEVLEILKQRLNARPVHNTTIIQIDSYSDRPMEAAQIANAVAYAYLDYCTERQAQMGTGEITGVQSHAVEIIDEAQPPARPIKPNRPLNIILGTFFAAFFGTAAAVLAAGGWMLMKRYSSPKIGSPTQNEPPQPRIVQRY